MSYNGILDVELSNTELADLYDGELNLGMKTNQYLVVRNKNKEIVEKKRWDGDKFVPLSFPKVKGFKSRSYKQDCLVDLLSNQEIPIKIIAGCPGSGKSNLSIALGMHFISKGVFQRLFVVRHNVSVGEKNGYLPGNKFEKIRGWLGFLEDNLSETQMTIEDLFSKGSLDVDSVEMMKGRSIENSFILIDEAEDLTEEQFKMLGERISYNSVMCFVGDYEQTTVEKYRNSSGLKRAIEKLAGNPLCGIVVFDNPETDNVRSPASKVFTTDY